MISISLFYCCQKVFIYMNTWMTVKNSMKYRYLKKRIYLNMEDITDGDHTKRVCKDFETKNIGEYHDFYVQSDTIIISRCI